MLKLNQGNLISVFVGGALLFLAIACADMPAHDSSYDGDLTTEQTALTDTGCFVDDMGGPTSCKDQPTWIGYAENACLDAGMVLAEYKFGKKCGQGLFRAIKYRCCPAEPIDDDPCVMVKLEKDDQCLTENEWEITNQAYCKEQFGMVMTQMTVGGQCADGGYHASKFLCCPAELDKDVCCLLSDGTYETVPASDCPEWNQDGLFTVVADELCDDPTDEPCVPANLGGSDHCLTEAQWIIHAQNACKEDYNMVMTQYSVGGQCGPGMYHGIKFLCCPEEVQEKICCKISFGPNTGNALYTNPDQCKKLGGIVTSDDYCEQEVCCKTSTGVQFVSMTQCPFADILPNASCESDPEPSSCETFKALDMGSLPVQLSNGASLLSYSGWGIWPTSLISSNSCSTIPLPSQRAAVGVNNDATLTFDQPITEFYLLTLYVQPGDDLTIAQPSTITQMGCVPGGQAGNGYYHIVLDTPSAVVTIQDVNSGGGSGYSFMIADCNDEPVQEDVCCELSTVQIVPADQCPQANVLPMYLCEDPVEDVCCKLGNGYQIVPANQCPAGHQVAMSYCEDPVVDVCCETSAGYQILPSNQCPWAQQVSMAHCTTPEPPTCENFEAINMAGLPSGNLSTGGSLVGYTGWGTWATGLPSSNSCSTIPLGAERGFVGVNQDATLTFDTPVNEFYLLQLHVQPGDELTIPQASTITQMGCAPGGFGGGAYYHVALSAPATTVTIQDINPGGGSGYSIMAANCVDEVVVEKVCCKLDTGFQIVPANQCPASQQVAMGYCIDPVEDVCCKLPGGPQVVPANLCPPMHVLPMNLCEEPPIKVCCKLPGGYQTVTSSDCPAGQQVPMSYCEDPVEDVCCKLDSGLQIVPGNQCPNGQQLPMAMCEDTEVCCKLAGGNQWVPASQCPPGHLLSDDMCTDEIDTCCRMDGQFVWVANGQCPDQFIAPNYFCEEVCCETPDGYQTLPGYQCPTNASVDDSYCDGSQLCDDAIYGQCEGFDYADQCNPKGFDCGPTGILGDLNCDGQYEVCLSCPAGTEPVDTNGDGCEDACDCIDDTTTPSGPVELKPAK